MKNWFAFCFFLLFFTLFSCREETPYSDIPEIIEYIGFEQFRDAQNFPQGRLTFRFIDGDGDVGLSDKDTQPPFDSLSTYYYNFFIDYYEKKDGEYVLIESPLTNNARIPVLSNKVPEPIEVQLSIDIPLTLQPLSDTLLLKFFIVDRELHHSNTMTTPELIRII